MNFRISNTLLSLLLTILLLMFLETISTALIPALGFHGLLLPFNVLFILFLAFRVHTPMLPIYVLMIQFFHSIFSVDGWAHGTLNGLVICLGINYLKNIINFTTTVSIMVITFVAMIAWYIMTAFLLYVSAKNLDLALNRLWGSFPECLIISLISPAFFTVLGRIWRVDLKNRVNA